MTNERRVPRNRDDMGGGGDRLAADMTDLTYVSEAMIAELSPVLEKTA
jgi:hypothetical protein